MQDTLAGYVELFFETIDKERLQELCSTFVWTYTVEETHDLFNAFTPDISNRPLQTLTANQQRPWESG